MAEQVSVVALQDGFFDGARRRKGAIFPVPSGTLAEWFAPVESLRAEEAAEATAAELAEEAAREASTPKTLSEMGRQTPATAVESKGRSK